LIPSQEGNIHAINTLLSNRKTESKTLLRRGETVTSSFACSKRGNITFSFPEREDKIEI
jgi:hypothetical protein